jgi:RNA-directed DNA polymerase
MRPRRSPEIYPLERSPFWRMGRQRDLPPLLQMEMKEIRRLAANREGQYWRRDEDIGGKQRKIVCPFGAMRRVHERLQGLFNRVQQPPYLHSPRRGHTALGNAGVHSHAIVVGKLDIRQFYPSTTDEHVFRFFRYRMLMQDDVAGLLVKLCTVDGRLPFGSPLSPICALSYTVTSSIGLSRYVGRHSLT